MADVFISYSHLDQAFALQLVGALVQRGLSAWLDRSKVFPAGEFREDIQARIEGAGAFLFLLSPDSVLSEDCKKELDYAVDCGKKLIPVLQREVNPDLVPQALRNLDWITDASFDRLLEKVLDALLVDKEDWNRSGRLQRLSREWEKNHKQNASLLLHGRELKRAEELLNRTERWKLEGSHKKPQTDDLQIEFIRASRRARNRFWLTSILVVLLLIGFVGTGTFLSLYHDPTLVTTQQDGPVGSLRWAVANAPSNSTITFASKLTGATIVLTGDLVIPGSKHLTLKYAGTGKLHISLPKNTLRVAVGASLTLFNLSLLGGISNLDSLLTNDGTLTLTNSAISGNTASGYGGGGIQNVGGTMTLMNSAVSGNTTSGPGGGGIYNSGKMTLMNSTISGNIASRLGGGGGGIYNSGKMTLMNSTISGNTASGYDYGGGGIYNSGTMTLMNGIISGNTALITPGGGIYNSGEMTLTNNTISGNTASGYDGGGGILNDGGTMTLTNSTISGNRASDFGGGGIYSSKSKITLTGSIVSGNTAPDGGGIYNAESTMTLTNSTVSGNTASGYDGGGGGIFNIGSTVILTFCTLYGNQATDGGGLTTQDDDRFGSPSIPGNATIQNNLIAGNSAPHHPDIAGKLTSKGYNLIQNGAGTTFIPTTGDQFVSDLSRVFASNVHLENNGGSTQTLALLTDPANPARGAIPLASCQIKEIYDAHARMYIDQRGMVRPGNKKTACDIGAYETQM